MKDVDVPTLDELKPLLQWAAGAVEGPEGPMFNGRVLASALTVEGMRLLKPVPPRLVPLVTRFRKLRSDARIVMCERFLRGRYAS